MTITVPQLEILIFKRNYSKLSKGVDLIRHFETIQKHILHNRISEIINRARVNLMLSTDHEEGTDQSEKTPSGYAGKKRKEMCIWGHGRELL